MTRPVGSNGWAARGGNLNRGDRVRLMGQALLTRLCALPENLRAAAGFGGVPSSRIDLGAIRLPDSSAAVRAYEHAQSLSEPWLFNHCLRTFIWGAMFAQAGRITFDDELLFTACALHDLGLTETHNGKAPDCHCFAVEGARAARRFAAGMGWEPGRNDRLAEAISLHLNVRVGLAQGAEAHLLHEGAALDVIGARFRLIPPGTVTAVLQQHPRLDFKERLVEAMKDQSRARPDSRAAFLAGLGFIGLIRIAPLDRST